MEDDSSKMVIPDVTTTGTITNFAGFVHDTKATGSEIKYIGSSVRGVYVSAVKW